MITLIRSILRARSFGLLRLRPATKPMRLECIGGKCGLCCMVMGGGIVVTSEEADGLPSGSTERKGRVIFLKNVEGTCCLLKGKMCKCYEQRPSGCREYPWYNVDEKLYYDRGCPGIKFDSDERPDVASIAMVDKYFPTYKWIRHFLITIFLHW